MYLLRSYGRVYLYRYDPCIGGDAVRSFGDHPRMIHFEADQRAAAYACYANLSGAPGARDF
jgi:hypothetical protein